jgi:hypothetical protein
MRFLLCFLLKLCYFFTLADLDGISFFSTPTNTLHDPQYTGKLVIYELVIYETILQKLRMVQKLRAVSEGVMALTLTHSPYIPMNIDRSGRSSAVN